MSNFKKVCVGILLLSAFVWDAYGGARTGHFTNLRDDLQVPEGCRQVSISNFKGPISYFTLGTKRAKSFDVRVDLERGDASRIWRLAKAYVNLERRHQAPDVERYIKRVDGKARTHLKVLLLNYKIMGFDFGSEGEVLELIAINQMLAEPDFLNRLISGEFLREGGHPFVSGDEGDRYFVTGSIEYHGNGGGRTIGELDIVIAEKSTCRVVAVGEAKLGRRSGKARSQLARFFHFLKKRQGRDLLL